MYPTPLFPADVLRALRALNSSIETPRLQLEPLVAAHAAAFFASLQDAAIYRWISLTPPRSVESLAERWARNESRISSDGSEAWLAWAVRRAHDGVYIGKIDATIADPHTANNVGYIFFPAFWGQGYATETLAAVVEHLMSHGIKRLVATVTAGNTASARLLIKAGFVFARVIPGNALIGDVAYDEEEYVFVNEGC